MVRGRAWRLALVIGTTAGAAWAEEPAQPKEEGARVVEVVDPYAEPEPRAVEIVDPYAEADAPAADARDLERVCQSYCLARKEELAPRRRALPPPAQPSEEWGSARDARLDGATSGPTTLQALGITVLLGSVLGGVALISASGSASDGSGGDNVAPILSSMAMGAGVVVGFALIVDGGGEDGAPRVQLASAQR